MQLTQRGKSETEERLTYFQSLGTEIAYGELIRVATSWTWTYSQRHTKLGVYTATWLRFCFGLRQVRSFADEVAALAEAKHLFCSLDHIPTSMLLRRPLALRTIHTYLLRQSKTTACVEAKTCHGRSRCLPSRTCSHRHQQCRAAQSAANIVTEPSMSPATSKTQLPAPARRLVHTGILANLLFRCHWQQAFNLCLLQKTSTFGCSAYRNPSSRKLLRRHTQLG